jgi:hypothetical protein
VRHFLTVLGGGEAVPTRSEVLGNGAIRGEKALRVPWGFKALQAPLALAGGLVGVLRAVVPIAVRPMLDAGPDLPLGRSITVELVRQDHARDIREPLEPRAKASLRRLLVSPPLHRNIEHVALLIHRSPEIMTPPTNGEAYFIQVPRVAQSGAPTTPLIGAGWPRLHTPLANAFVGHEDSAGESQLFDIAIAQTEAAIQPHLRAAELSREAVILVSAGRECAHAMRIAHQTGVGQAAH